LDEARTGFALALIGSFTQSCDNGKQEEGAAIITVGFQTKRRFRGTEEGQDSRTGDRWVSNVGGRLLGRNRSRARGWISNNDLANTTPATRNRTAAPTESFDGRPGE